MPAQMELCLSPVRLDDPAVLVKFKELNPNNYYLYRQVRKDVCAFFGRVWGILDLDLPYLEVHLVKCHTKIK